MNPAFVYRQHGRSIFWIAFMSALAIHLGAVALAKTKSPPATLEDFNPPGDVELLDTAEPEPPLLEESATPPPLEQIHPDQDIFREENLTPPPVRAHRKARPASLLRGTAVSLRSVKAMVAYAPRPAYPYEARRQRVTGSGVALLTVDETLGTVTDVVMAQSCGNAILGQFNARCASKMAFQARECGHGSSADHVHAYGRFILALTVGACVILCARRKDIRSDAKPQHSQTGGIRGNCTPIRNSASSIRSTHN